MIAHTTIAAGVTRFTWSTPGEHGDGLLVDVATASPRWLEVADVLLWSVPVDPATAAARAARSHATLAVVARQPAEWLVLAPPAVVLAGDWPALLAVIVEHYRAAVGVTPRTGKPPGHA